MNGPNQPGDVHGIHYRHPESGLLTCGMPEMLQSTADPAQVTCQGCLDRMSGAWQKRFPPVPEQGDDGERVKDNLNYNALLDVPTP